MPEVKESWTDWILSSYSSSVNPSNLDLPITPYPEPESEPSTESSVSPWGPYAKTGRGGAGNFTWESDLPQDVEAQTHPSLRVNQRASTFDEESERVDKLRVKKRPTDIHTGRGGAGNLSATYAAQSPRSPSWPISPTSEPSPTKARAASTVHGRGGAGNFAASAAVANQAKDEKIDEERKMAEDLREKAEHDVENMLRPPEGAFLAGSRRRESAVGV